MYKILKLFTVLAVVFAFSPVSRAQTVVDGNTAKFLREFDDKKIKPAHIDTSYWSTSKEIRSGAECYFRQLASVVGYEFSSVERFFRFGCEL